MQKVNLNGIESAISFKQNSKNITNTLKEEPSKEADFESYDKAIASNVKAGIAFKGNFLKNRAFSERINEIASKTADRLSQINAKEGETLETTIKQDTKAIAEQVIADVRNESGTAVKPIIDGVIKAEEKIEEKAKNLLEDLLNIGDRPLTRPLLFKEQNENALFYNLSNPKPQIEVEMAPPELKAVLAEINKDALDARELASKFMDEIVHSPEYLQKRQAILDIYQNKKYASILQEYELELLEYPKEMIEAFKNGQREFTNIKEYGGGVLRVVSDKEAEELMHGSILINNGKIKLDYALRLDGNIGYTKCNNATQPILKDKAPNMFFYTCSDGKKIDRVSVSSRKNNDWCGGVTYEYSDYIPNYCVKMVTKNLPDNDYNEAIKFLPYGEVKIGLPGLVL